MDIYYVYAYVDEDGAPYYIGKGKGRRAFGGHRVSVPTDKSKIIFLHENISEPLAFKLERKYIAQYGRKDLETGILLNRSNGGEGGSNKRTFTKSISKKQKPPRKTKTASQQYEENHQQYLLTLKRLAEKRSKYSQGKIFYR